MVRVTIEGESDVDGVELDALTHSLRARLLELEIADATALAAEPPPERTRSAESALLGGLAVTLGPIALKTVVAMFESWMKHRPVRSVSVMIGRDKLTIENASRTDQRAVIDSWVAQHAPHE